MDKKTKQSKEIRVMFTATPEVQDEINRLIEKKLTQPKAVEKMLEDYCKLKAKTAKLPVGKVLTDQDVYNIFGSNS